MPWTEHTLVPVYSTTKPIATLILARLIDAGTLFFDAPVAHVWPEFSAHGKDRVTVAQALSHQAGVPGFVDPIDPGLWLDPQALGEALAALKPLWLPGTAHGYHPLTFGYIAGELARRADAKGRSLGTQLREDIAEPNQIDFHIGLADAHHGRCAEIARPKELPDLGTMNEATRAAFGTPWSAPNRGGPEWRRVEIPSANGHGTALSTAKLYGIFANGGQLNGTEILSPAALAAMLKPRIRGADLVLPFDLAWSSGILANSNAFYGPNPNSFGHSGWGGSCAFADPDRNLSAAYVMNKQSNALMGDARSLALIAALYRCVV
jgi:CubicO group peptidase (beta-lactamase class C family)